MNPPAPIALTMEELKKLHSPQSQELCKERDANSSAGEETLVEINKDADPRPMSEQDNNKSDLASKNADLTSLHGKVVNLPLVVKPNEASNASRFTDIETRVTKLENRQSSTDVSNKSNRDQVTLADLAKRLEVLETFVYSMPMDLTKTIGKPKCIPPPSAFELERRIAALERAINANTAQEGRPTIGFEGSSLKPVPWTNISASNDAGTSRSLSPFEQVPRIAEDVLDKSSNSSKYLTLPAPPGEIDPFQHPPSPAYPPSEDPQDSDAAGSMGPEELVGPEFAWLPERPERPAVSPVRSEDGSAGNGSFFDVEKDRLK